jgi:DNA uptake protein ComE-like DNA-binding protein
MKRVWVCMLGLIPMMGCSPASRSPDAIRSDTAVATSAAARDAKAVAQGVFEGLREKGPLNVNRASEAELEGLPGIDEAAARRIVAGRPYASSTELLHRRILTKRQYDGIASRVVAK